MLSVEATCSLGALVLACAVACWSDRTCVEAISSTEASSDCGLRWQTECVLVVKCG
jgi:hypothetical protein